MDKKNYYFIIDSTQNKNLLENKHKNNIFIKNKNIFKSKNYDLFHNSFNHK